MDKQVGMAFTAEEIETIEAALALLQDTDNQNGRHEQAARTRDLIDRIANGECTLP